ncbi:hypothetical protein OV208_34860 [Corallococcus sp. bb12-1]|uniref:hypothetical protein n=1 Tax=Corallococcus sp. bb12-1 TaxID=2996784 RepID=UPI00226DF124|nr:hypothetical protein [Corallococcus sp. bb12-1]MCY1046538.1 hypothetical protein [Corallococcus sp. bb12-1]
MRKALARVWWVGLTGLGLLLGACQATVPVAPAVPVVGSTPGGPFVAEAQALFDGCVPVPSSATSRTYRCGGLSVWLDELTGVTEAQAVQEGHARVRARLGLRLTEVTGELPLAGQSHPSLRFSKCADLKGAEPCRAGGYLTAVTPSVGRVRQLGCVARDNARADLGRCLELFAYLSTKGNPEGDVLSPSSLITPPFLPWRVLGVPEGCQLAASTTRAGRIRCDASTFSWSIFRPVQPGTSQVERWHDQSVEELRDALPGASPVELVDCYLEGQATRCARFTAPSPDGGGDVVVWTGGVDWQEQGLFAACSFAARAFPFPASCNGVFAPR